MSRKARLRFTAFYLCRTAKMVLACLLLGFSVSITITSTTTIAAPAPTPGTVLEPIKKPVLKPKPSSSPPVQHRKKDTLQTTATSKKILIKTFEFKGSSIFNEKELAKAISDYYGKKLTLAQIYQAADVIENLYRRRGYMLASVYLPAQKISSGKVILEILEGRRGEILVEGEMKSYTEAFIKQQLDELSASKIVSEDILEKEILLLNELPGLTARAIISPGKEYGSSDVTFKVEEDIVSGTVRLNNYGRDSIGETRLEGGLIYANPFGIGDQFNFSAIVSDSASMVFVRIDYDALINNSGTRLGFGVSNFDYEVDTAKIGLAGTLEGSGTNTSIKLVHPYVRARREQMDLGFVIRHSETDETGITISPDRSISLLDLVFAWRLTHGNRAKTSMTAMLSTNFDDYVEVTNEEGQKAKLSLDVVYFQPLSANWFYSLKLNAAHSSDPLADVERFRIGGPTSVRAFPSAELAGDRGAVVSLDVGKSFRAADGIIMTAKAFVDAGSVSRELPLAGESKSESLAGFGLGLVTLFGMDHSLQLEVVKQSGDRISSDGDDSRVWINYSAKF